MGQRLVVSVQYGGKNISSIYYHWSAYTRSALEEARDIVECLHDTNAKTVKEIQLALIHMCEKNGGGIAGGLDSSLEGIYIQTKWPREKFRKAKPDRSYGLIAITESGMDEMMEWAEGELVIDVEEQMIYNEVFCSSGFGSWKEFYGEVYGKTQEELDRMTLMDIPQLQHSIEEVPFHEINELLHELEIYANNGINTVRRGRIVYEMIE